MGILDHVAEQIKQLPRTTVAAKGSLSRSVGQTHQGRPQYYIQVGLLACIDIEIWEFPNVIGST